MATPGLAGRTIGVTAERRSAEQADLLARRGAEVVHGPTMRTLDLADDARLRAATEELVARPPDVFVATTGYGVRLWLEAADGWGVRDQVVAALAASRVVARGPKSRSALRQAGVREEWTAPSESMDEVVAHLAGEVAGARLALQLFDPDDHPSTALLRSAAAELVEVPVYRWALPTDIGPAVDLVRRAVAGAVDAVTFTSQPALRFMFRLAGEVAAADGLRRAFNGEGPADVLPVCIGPVCAEAGVEVGIAPDRLVWPEPFRLVPMVRLVEERLGSAVP